MSVPPSSKSESSTQTVSDADIEKLLSREASAFQRELEVERILKAFKLKCVSTSCSRRIEVVTDIDDSPYDILDLDISATQDEIKKRYRYLSLCTSVASLIFFFKMLNFFSSHSS